MADTLSSSAIAIVGAGSIGVGWAVVFAAAGRPVRLFDPAAERLRAAPGEIAARIEDLHACGLCPERAADVLARITAVADLPQAVAESIHIQECAPEQLELKRRLFAELDALAPPGCPIASSSSFMPASRLAADLPGRARCLVVHPGNPPFLLRVAEVVPAPFTAPETVERTEATAARVSTSIHCRRSALPLIRRTMPRKRPSAARRRPSSCSTR